MVDQSRDGYISGIVSASHQSKENVEVLDVVEIVNNKDLVVFNDDFNTFDHVIRTLIRVCKHTPQQAEQCTWIIHHRGKCTVKTGSFDELQPMRQSICDEGIDAKIL